MDQAMKYGMLKKAYKNEMVTSILVKRLLLFALQATRLII